MTEFFTKNINTFNSFLDSNHISSEVYSNISHAAASLTFDNIDPLQAQKYFINIVIKYMKEYPGEWNKHASQNAEWIGNQLLDYLNGGRASSDENYLLYIVFKFMYEFYLSCGYDIDNEYVALINLYLGNKSFHPVELEDKFNYAINSMPLAILKGIFSRNLREKLDNIEDLYVSANKSVNTIKDFEDNWDKQLIAKEKKISALENRLKEYEDGFNFVGLFKGFKELKAQKKEELLESTKSANTWKFLTALLPTIALIAASFFPISTTPNFSGLLYHTLPLATLLGLSLYFYRISLISQKSIKSQLLQIDLRMTLCQFIQSYAEYSETLKDKNSHTLQKFEEIIFSGIVADDEKLPTSFDGIEQLGKVLQNLKK